MTNTIIGLVNRAANTRNVFPIAQQSTALREAFPFGDMKAIVALLIAQGMTVSSVCSDMLLINNTAWMTVDGVIKPI
jgi:hypothetical protein